MSARRPTCARWRGRARWRSALARCADAVRRQRSAAGSLQPPPSTLYSVTRFCACAAAPAPPPAAPRTASAAHRAGRGSWPRRCGSAGPPAAGAPPRPSPAPAARAAARRSVARPASASATSRNAVWIALLVLRHARCRAPPSAACRLAWLRPASKIGSSSCGAKRPVANEPPWNRPDSSLLAVPTLPVSVMRGKNAARAAPMLALAAISCCSAWRTSGRRSSTSDGRPAGRSASSCCSASGSAGGQVGSAAAGRAAAPARSRPAHAGACLRQRHARRFDQRLGLPQVELRRRRRCRTSASSACSDSSRVASVCACHLQQLVVGRQRQVRVRPPRRPG